MNTSLVDITGNPVKNRLKVGDIVTVPIKNRWGFDRAATIAAIHPGTVDAIVWNMDGPGADRLVTGIPHKSINASENN